MPSDVGIIVKLGGGTWVEENLGWVSGSETEHFVLEEEGKILNGSTRTCSP